MTHDISDERVRQGLPDRDLVALARQAQDPVAREHSLHEIYRRHGESVIRSCVRYFTDLDRVRDAAAAAFEIAIHELTDGLHPPREPDKLRAWLRAIAKNRCVDELRRLGHSVTFDDTDVEYDDYDLSSRRRQAEVDRIMDVVAGSFTAAQQRVYQLNTRQGLRGQQLAIALGIDVAQAYREANENKHRIMQGFGAYVLAKDGRPFCARLSSIIDEYGWEEVSLSRVLRLRILRHLDNCKTCDNCAECRNREKRLILPYTPALIPALVVSEVHERVTATIRRVAYRRMAPAAELMPLVAIQPPQQRKRGPRRLPVAIAAAAALVIILGAVVIPRVVSSISGGQLATLAGPLGNWQIPAWQVVSGPNGGVPNRGASTWSFDGECQAAAGCVLQVQSASNGPDGLYTKDLAGAVIEGPPRQLRLTSAGGIYTGSNKYIASCGDSVDISPDAFTDTVEIRIVDTAPSPSGPVATRIEITWTTVEDPGPLALQVGCVPTTQVLTGPGSRS